jgi:hypothetical protein
MENKKSNFLTTLCILTFIGSGLGLLGAIFGIVGSIAFPLSFFVAGKYSLMIYTINLIASLLCLSGAIMMWKLQLRGYWFYLGGTLVSIIGSILTHLQTNETLSELNSFSYTGLIVAIVISVVFVGMYTVNKKQLQ